MEKEKILPGMEAGGPLLTAANEFVESFDALDKSKTRKEEAELKLLEAMEKVKISSLNHGGHTLVVQKGRVTDDKIKLK